MREVRKSVRGKGLRAVADKGATERNWGATTRPLEAAMTSSKFRGHFQFSYFSDEFELYITSLVKT